jgi:predicted kinase
MGTVVELCGLPGAGKSHLARRLRAALAEHGVVVHSPGDRVGPDVPRGRRLAGKLGMVTRQAMDEPGRSIGLATALRTAPGDERVGALARWVAWAVAQRLVSDGARRHGVSVLDEGVLQALWSIGLRSDVRPVLRLLEADSAAWVTSSLVVVVEAPVDLVERRLAARASQHSRTQRLGPAERRRELRRGADVLERLADWWESTAGPTSPVVRLGEPHRTEPVVSRVLERLEPVRRQQAV